MRTKLPLIVSNVFMGGMLLFGFDLVSSGFCNAAQQIPLGFENIRPAERFKAAWENKAMLVTVETFAQEVTMMKAYCFEFGDFENGELYAMSTDGTIVKRSGEIEIDEFIVTKEMSGWIQGDHALWFGIPGMNLNFNFNKVIVPTDQSFTDRAGYVYEIKPGGYCASLQGEQ